MGTVRYRLVPGFTRYRVGTDGTLWSGQNTCGRPAPWRLMRRRPGRGGYVHVVLRNDEGTLVGVDVHALVLRAFSGPCPVGMESRHKNGKRDENRLENLCWGTHKSNAEDARRHGTDPTRERNGHAKLTWDAVRAIRRLRAAGERVGEIARCYGVVPASVTMICNGSTWRERASE